MRGDRVKELRTSHGYSREKLAKMLDIGEASIPRYENNEQLPSAAVVKRLAELFSVTSDYLLGLTDNPIGYRSEDISVLESRVLALLRVSSHDDQTRMLKVLELMADHRGGTGV